jgi:hypothetical protein
MITLPLVTEHQNFPQTAAERTVNWYAEKVGNNFILRCTPGLNLFATVPGYGGMRGLMVALGDQTRLFAVRGNGFYEWDGSAFVLRGNLTSNTGVVGMAYNNTQCIVVDDTKGYGYEFGDPSSFREIPNFPGGGSQVVFSQLRMVTIQPGTGFFWVSNQDDVFTWNPLAGADTESFPDPLVAIAALGNTLYLFGSGSYEIWTSSTNFELPFARTNMVFQKIGCAARHSVSVFGPHVYFLGGNAEGRGIVYRMVGSAPQRISDNRIEQIIQSMPSIDDAVGFCYQEQGHVFYVLSFGVGDKTLVYDATTGLWAERNYRNPVTGQVNRRPEIVQAVFGDKMLVGDWRNGDVYEMSRNYFTDGTYLKTVSSVTLSGDGAKYVALEAFNLNNPSAKYFNISYYFDSNEWVVLAYDSAYNRDNYINPLGFCNGISGNPKQLVVVQNDSGEVQASFYLETITNPELPVSFDADFVTEQVAEKVPVVREKVFPVWPEEQIARTKVPPFALFLDMGKTPSGAEAPKAMLSYSEDRGETYGNEHYRELGTTGQYGKRIVWHGQGTTWGRNYKLRITGGQDFVLRNAGLLEELSA